MTKKDKLDRDWKYRPSAGWFFGRLYFGITHWLTKIHGKPCKIVARAVAIEIILDPRQWKIGQEHTYYDGNWCYYQFGPFAWVNSGWAHCEKCWGVPEIIEP